MARVYGLKPASEDPLVGGAAAVGGLRTVSNAHFMRRLGENHGFEYKKVPLNRRDGHLLSDLASPEESTYAKRKLLTRQRKDQALRAQKESKSRQLEMSYHLASPAARIRNLIATQQKR